MTVRRALSALLALILLMGQIQPAAAQLVESSDSHAEPPTQSAQTAEDPTAEVTQPATETLTEAPTETPTETPTQAPTERPTEAPAPTQAPAKDPAQSPTQAPAPATHQKSAQAAQQSKAPAQASVPRNADTDTPDETDTSEQSIVARFEEEPTEVTDAPRRAGALPDSEPDVTITLTGELPVDADVVAADAADEAFDAGLTHIVCAYDITINDGWQPEQAVEVAIANREIEGEIQVYHIGEDGVPEQVPVTRAEDGRVVFPAEGFSIYVVTDNLYRRSYEFMDYKYGQWLPYEFNMTLPADPDDPLNGLFTSSRQILRNGDRLVVPSLPNKDNMRFLGWYTSFQDDVNYLNPERGGIKNDITSDSIVTLYARYGKPVTITFYARGVNEANNQVFTTKTVLLGEDEGSTTLDLSDQLFPEAPDATQRFVGWVLAGAPETLIDISAFEVSGNVTLYPRFETLHEITFQPEDDQEAYIAPVWVGEDGVSGQLTEKVPYRAGYTFAGWTVGDTPITDGSSVLLNTDLTFPGGSLSGGVLRLTGDITLNSHWEPNSVQYRVIFWRQKTSDTKKLVCTDGVWAVPNDQKEYDFLGTLRIDAVSGEEVPMRELEDAYTHLAEEGVTDYPLDEGPADFTGLVFRELQDGHDQLLTRFVVAGDGTNIVHVFYDRKLVSLTFDFPEDVTAATDVAEPGFYPELPAGGTVTQKAVTAIQSADYPDDLTITGLYGGQISDGKTASGETPRWPVTYTVHDAAYTLTTRTMQYSGGNWVQKSSSSTAVSTESKLLSSRWVDERGNYMSYQEAFGFSAVLTPAHRLDNLRESTTDAQLSFYKENTEAAYPAAAVYSSTPAMTFSVIPGEQILVLCPFSGYELDYFTYTDSKGTPIRRDSDATMEQRILSAEDFTNLKVYCKRNLHHVYFHNGSEMTQGPGVKYGNVLSTDYVKQAVTTPALPPELEGQAEQLEFAGWFLDQECTIFFDTVGLKSGGRASLMLQYEQIQMIVSVYDYRPAAGVVIPARKMDDNDLHLFAGWVPKRVLVELEPEGGELPADVPTFFWKNYGDTLSVFPITRDYVPAEAEPDTYRYHYHSYEQSLLDNDTSDRSAVYLSASEGDAGTRYKYQPGSYRFLGWFLVGHNPNGTEVLTPYDHEQQLTESVKLRAQWSRTGVYKIIYDQGEHGRINGQVSTDSYQDHATIQLNGDIAADAGYAFTGWRVRRPNGSGELMDTLYSSSDSFVLNADWAEITLDVYTGIYRGNITLVAQYEPIRGTSITYYVNGGSFVGPGLEQQEMDPELARELKEKLVRDYGKNAAHHYLFDSTGEIIGYTVSGIEQNANLTTEDGTWFQRSGYKLMGWSSTPTGSVELELHMGGFNAADDPEGNGHVLYAVWKPEIQVTFDLRGGTWNSANGPEYRNESGLWIYGAGNGETAPVPKAPTKPGYTFIGWSNQSTAKTGLQTMPKVTKSITLYAVWTANVVLRFHLGGGTWPSLTKGFAALDPECYGVSVNPGSTYTLPTVIPTREGGYLFYKWEQGSYHYDPGEQFKTSAEQAGQTLTLNAKWSASVSAVEVLVGSDDSITIEDADSLVGASEDGSSPVAPRVIEGYQYLYAVYDELPQEKGDIAEHYRVTSIRHLGENTYRVTMANGQTKIHYPESAEKLQAVYIQARDVEVHLKRMNVFEDGLDEMNLTLTSLKTEPYTVLSVGKVDIQNALPKPNDYAKVGATNYRSYTYAIGYRDAENMYAIDTMTKGKLWIRQTLNGYAFSVNGEEWKDLEREDGEGKNVAVYIIYDNRVETFTTITHKVYGLKSDKEILFTYNVYVRGRWGFNIGSGTNGAYFLHKPDDPSENLNSYTVALSDGQKVEIPLHIDYLTGYKQEYKVGDLFYDMFGGDHPTLITNRSEKRIWQEVEMRRANALPFTNGTFETSIQLKCTSHANSNNFFNGYDTENHEWLKQLGISKASRFEYHHSFIYTRTSVDVPIHVLELTRDGYVLRDSDWLKDGAQTLSVTADALTVDDALAATMVEAPEGFAMQAVHYGLSIDEMAGTDQNLVLRLAAERNDPTLLHVYDYETTDESSTRSLVSDGSEVYLVYFRHSSAEVPVEYVKRDSSGAFTPVDMSGYGLSVPNITVTDSESVDFRKNAIIQALNGIISTYDAIYPTGRMLLADQKGNVLATCQPGDYGDWDTGQALELRNSEAGVIYTADDGTQQISSRVRVWIELDYNVPLRIMGRLWQRGRLDENTGVIPYLPRDDSRRVVADGTQIPVNETFDGFKNWIPYAADPDREYTGAQMGEGGVVSVAYCTDEYGYRHWTYKIADYAAPESVSKILYADYLSLYSPVNVRYVIEKWSRYVEAEGLDVPVVNTLRVDRNGVNPADALQSTLDSIDENSTLYRSTGTVVLGSDDLLRTYLTDDTGSLVVKDSQEGLVWELGGESDTLSALQFPDVYVVLRPIATLTVSKRIDNEGGYCRYEDTFHITVTLNDTSYNEHGTCIVTSDSSIPYAMPAEPGTQEVNFVDGVAEITLCHGQSITIPELPRDVYITVTEEPTELYVPYYRIVQGAKVTSGNTVELSRHSTVEVINVSQNIVITDETFSDGFAYALLLCGGAAYALYVLLRRRRRR